MINVTMNPNGKQKEHAATSWTNKQVTKLQLNDATLWTVGKWHQGHHNELNDSNVQYFSSSRMLNDDQAQILL